MAKPIYFYFRGARGAFLAELGRARQAHEAFDRAIALANTAQKMAFIRLQIALLTPKV